MLMKVIRDAESGFGETCDDKARVRFERIRDTCKEIGRTFRTLFPKAYDELKESHLSEVDINEIILKSFSKAKERLASMGIVIQRFDSKIELSPAPKVQADADELIEAICEIMVNAVEAMAPHGGILNVCSGRAYGRAQIQIKDSGVGMDENELKYATHPFFTTKGERRLGVGLTLAKAAIRRHGGSLRIESEKGVSTTVTITLPPAEE